MNASAGGRSEGPARYEIRLGGRLDTRWGMWFDGLTLTNEDDATTTLRGPLVDQAALHGVLQKLRDTGLPLISVTQVVESRPDSATPRPARH